MLCAWVLINLVLTLLSNLSILLYLTNSYTKERKFSLYNRAIVAIDFTMAILLHFTLDFISANTKPGREQ